MTLATSLIEKNNLQNSFAYAALSNNSEYYILFVNLLRNTYYWELTEAQDTDDVKFTESIVSISSAIDLYAVENEALGIVGRVGGDGG